MGLSDNSIWGYAKTDHCDVAEHTHATVFLTPWLDSSRNAKMCHQGARSGIDVQLKVRHQSSCSAICEIACCQHCERMRVMCTSSTTCATALTCMRQWAGGGSPHLTPVRQPASLPTTACGCQAFPPHRRWHPPHCCPYTLLGRPLHPRTTCAGG